MIFMCFLCAWLETDTRDEKNSFDKFKRPTGAVMCNTLVPDWQKK
jgi:hypothetical protein